MSFKDELTKKFKLVSMNEVDISSDDKPIIGTQALATCVGLILYCEEKHKAIVAHFSSEWEMLIKNVFDLVFENEMQNCVIKYKVIPGYYVNHYDVEKSLNEVFSSLNPLFVPFKDSELSDNAICVNEELTSCQFAFDSLNGMFVTDKVFFGEDYINLCGSKIKN